MLRPDGLHTTRDPRASLAQSLTSFERDFDREDARPAALLDLVDVDAHDLRDLARVLDDQGAKTKAAFSLVEPVLVEPLALVVLIAEHRQVLESMVREVLEASAKSSKEDRVLVGFWRASGQKGALNCRKAQRTEGRS